MTSLIAAIEDEVISSAAATEYMAGDYHVHNGRAPKIPAWDCVMVSEEISGVVFTYGQDDSINFWGLHVWCSTYSLYRLHFLERAVKLFLRKKISFGDLKKVVGRI